MATNETRNSAPKKWQESSGFLFSVIMLGGAAWGLSEGVANGVVSTVVGATAALKLGQQFLKTSKYRGIMAVVKDGNTWVYLTGVLGQFLPNAGELVPSLQGLSDGIISKDFGRIISAVFAVGVFIWKVVKPDAKTQKA